MHELHANNRTLVFVPTYNERDNVKWLHSGIRSLGLDLDLLFIDDNSPDGTGQVLDALALEDSRLYVVHQTEKRGIGFAHKRGIQWAFEKGYKTLITMDADLTHSPSDLPKLLQNSPQYHVVLGSRYLQQNSLNGWNFTRKILTRVGNFLTTFVLGIKQDATGAFRAYRLDTIPCELFESVESNSYSFFFESLHLLHKNGFTICEVPIALSPRTYGSSKMQLKDIFGSLKMLAVIFVKTKFKRARFKPKAQLDTGNSIQ